MGGTTDPAALAMSLGFFEMFTFGAGAIAKNHCACLTASHDAAGWPPQVVSLSFCPFCIDH